MQGSFPLAPRPYARVAALAEVDEDEVLRRVQRLLDERIIRQVTPIFDTRVLGYSRCWWRPRSTPRTRTARRKIVNSHPGVSHNYLRNHDFNMWFTIATEPGSELGLRGHARRARRADRRGVRPPAAHAQAVQDQHGLEMEGGTKDLAAAGVAQDPMEPDPIELSELDWR